MFVEIVVIKNVKNGPIDHRELHFIQVKTCFIKKD